MKPKVIISGTGRCGTTFLMMLFTFLGFDTGFTKQNFKAHVDSTSRAGMETKLNTPHYIVKNPQFIEEDYLKYIINNNIPVKYFIIPIRKYSESAESRANLKTPLGGLWKANTKESQELFYDKLMSTFLFYSVKNDFNVIFLDFERMTKNKKYLYEMLLPILKEKTISFEKFSIEYDECSVHAKKK